MKAVEKRDLTMCSQRRFERVEAHSVIPPNEAREKNYAGIALSKNGQQIIDYYETILDSVYVEYK